MLYKTHQKFAQLFGVVGLTSAFSASLMPTFSWGYSISDNILVGTLIIMGYSASTFGGEFPDIDSATSVPARRYPFLRRLFTLFGVNHRGKFSHDFTSLAILFGLLLGGAYISFTYYWNNWFVMLGIALYLLMFYGREIGNDIAFKLAKSDQRRRKIRIPINLTSSFLLFIGFLLMGWFPITSSSSTLLQASSALKPMTYVTIVFACVGAYSHLFADMLTNEGVYILWQKISPAKWVLRFKKLPFVIPMLMAGIGWFTGQIFGAILGGSLGILLQYMVITTDLKTGSPYEKFVRKIVKLLLVPTTLVLIYTAFGGVLK